MLFTRVVSAAALLERVKLSSLSDRMAEVASNFAHIGLFKSASAALQAALDAGSSYVYTVFSVYVSFTRV